MPLAHIPGKRRTARLALAAGLVAALTAAGPALAVADSAPTAPASPASPTSPATGSDAPGEPGKDAADKLGSADATLLAKAKADGDKNVTFMIAGKPGSTAEISSRLHAQGASVGQTYDRLGYVRATVPTAKADAAIGAAQKLPSVLAIDLRQEIKLDDPTPAADTTATASRRPGRPATAYPGPDKHTPAKNPYQPAFETGAVDFVKDHPTADGRGVTIGILDSGVDVGHPALQKTTTGERKIVDWVTSTDPILDGDATWRAMVTSVSGPSFTTAGRNWTAPAGGYLFSTFAEAATKGGDMLGDLNRDGDTTDVWGVLYDPVAGTVRVDLDNNGDFGDDTAMKPYKDGYQIGHFGTDNPGHRDLRVDPLHHRDPQERPDGPLRRHLGRQDGRLRQHRPGAVRARHARRRHHRRQRALRRHDGRRRTRREDRLLAGLHLDRRLHQHRADGGHDRPGGQPPRRRRQHVHRRPRRAQRRCQRPRPALPAADRHLRGAAGDLRGQRRPRRQHHQRPGPGRPRPERRRLHLPRDLGGQLRLADHRALLAAALLRPRPARGRRPGPRHHRARRRHQLRADLGAGRARHRGRLRPAARLRHAPGHLDGLTAGHRSRGPAAVRREGSAPEGHPGAAAHGADQHCQEHPRLPDRRPGRGPRRRGPAWNLLRRGGTTDTYTVKAPVDTALSSYLQTPGYGTGVYDREGGLTTGQKRTYKVTVTRTGGPAHAQLQTLRWAHNDGTFSVASPIVLLPLNKPVTVRITAKPRSAGVHSALLNVDDPLTGGTDTQISAAVVVSTPIAGPSYTLTRSGTIQRDSTRSYFLTVPAGATSLEVSMGGLKPGSQTRFVSMHPYGVPLDSTQTPDCYPNYDNPANTCRPDLRSYADPLPGVWEVEVEARRTSPQLDNPYVLTASVLGAAFDPAVQTVPSAQVGTPAAVNWNVTNGFAPISGGSLRGGPLGSALTATPTIAEGDTQTTSLTLGAGASRLDVSIGSPSDQQADLDLYVYRDGVLIAQSADGDAEEAVSLADPAPGTYTFEVDGYSVPSGSTTYSYEDVYYSAALGQVAVDTSTPVNLPHGASIPVTASVVAAAEAPAGRQLFGQVQLLDAGGTPAGTGSVIITSTTP